MSNNIPCRFCGCKDTVDYSYPDENSTSFRRECCKCNQFVEIYFSTTPEHNSKELSFRWNARNEKYNPFIKEKSND